MRRHREDTFTRGDTWIINGKLFDNLGAPLPLPDDVDTLVEWALLDDNRITVASCTSGTLGGITITDRINGFIQIAVPKASTAVINPGDYFDALRATLGSQSFTMWVGPLTVEDSPFGGN